MLGAAGINFYSVTRYVNVCPNACVGLIARCVPNVIERWKRGNVVVCRKSTTYYQRFNSR